MACPADQPEATTRLIAVVGATATGKSDVAVALAQALGGEIVGADSRQVYRGMAIGTAQPPPEQLRAVPHHLIGNIAPDAAFGLASYLDLAKAAIADIRSRGRVAIVAGGTGQYVRALLEDWTVPRVPPDRALRAALAAEAHARGVEALHTRLAAVDPTAATAIHPNNMRRVIRALEVFAYTGRPISAQQRASRSLAIVIGLALPRDTLYERIDRRVEAMYAAGLLDEVAALAAAGYGPHLPSMASIGYPEAWAAHAGDLDPAEAIRRTQLATHRLARQQHTWFRPDDARIAWLDAAEPWVAAQAIETVRRLLRGRGPDLEANGAVHEDARDG